MRESFGARLRRRREEQGVRLATIADNTKIKLSLLEALERDDLSHWPAGIFRRAYVRTYAQAIDLDPDAVVREFLEVFPDPQEVFETALASALAAQGGTNAAPPTRLRTMVGSALDSLSRLRRAQPGMPAVRTLARPVEAVEAPIEEPIEESEVHPPDIFEVAMAADDGPVMDREPPAVDTRPAPPVASRDDGDGEVEPVLPKAPFDLGALARLCSRIAGVETAGHLQPMLADAASLLEATGLIVWIWDGAEGLTPALACGYSDRVLAQLPTVGLRDDNATAAAFRTARACTIGESPRAGAALAVPLITSTGCTGVLAVELQRGADRDQARNAAGIVGALIAQAVERYLAMDDEGEPDEVAAVEPYLASLRRAGEW